MGKGFYRHLFVLVFATLLAVTAAGDDVVGCTSTATSNNDGPYCDGATISLTAAPDGGTAYVWSGPNGFTSTLQNPTIANATLNNAGTYDVTVTANGCISTASTTLTVNSNPSSTITAPNWVTTTSTGNTATAPLDAGSCSWSINNGWITAGQTEQTVIFTAGSTGTLTLTQTTTNSSGCHSTSSQDVRVDPQPTVTIGDVQRAEGDSGYTLFDFPVRLSIPSSQTVTVEYYTSNSTALAGSDYVSVPLTTLTFNPGDLTKYVTVRVIGDARREINELFVVTIRNPTNATLGAKYKGWGSITNDD